MRTMQDSGVEWVGDIPNNWNMNKIGAIYQERNTKVSDKDYEPLSVTMQGVVPQLETAAKTDNGDNRKLVKSNDFVINSRSDRRGSCGISSMDGSVSLINIVLKPRKNMNNQYYQYVFKSERFADEFYRWGNGIVDDLWSTKWSSMKRIYIPQPDLGEQKCIADFLNQKCAVIDRITEKQQAVIEKLKAYKQNVISHAVANGMNNAPMKKTGYFWFDSVPEHWQVGQLKHFASLRSGLTLGKSYPSHVDFTEYHYLRVANVQGGYVDLSDVAIIKLPHGEAKKYLLESGEVLMTEGGDRDKLGRGCIWKGEIEPCLHQNHIFAIRTKESKLCASYFDYLTTSDIGRNYFDYTAKKTTNLASTNSSTILNFHIPIPPIEEQKEIVAYLDSFVKKIDDIISNKELIICSLSDYKKSLIFEAVTGKIEVHSTLPTQFPATVNCKSQRFAQAVLVSKIIDELDNKANGRVKLEKVLCTIETHIGFDFDTQYKRQVAGPFDESIYKCEGIIINQNKWFTLQGKGAVQYRPTQDKDKYKPYYEKYFSEYDTEISRIIAIFKPFNMDQAEIFATLYAAWNDAIIRGDDVTDEAVVNDVLNNWNESKKRFSKDVWFRAMQKMREVNLVPKGYGKLTQMM